jgi:hypothetical protein
MIKEAFPNNATIQIQQATTMTSKDGILYFVLPSRTNIFLFNSTVQFLSP